MTPPPPNPSASSGDPVVQFSPFLSHILSQAETLHISPSQTTQLHNIYSLHQKIVLLLKSPPVNLNYEFYYDEKEVARIFAEYEKAQRAFEEEFERRIKDRLVSSEKGTLYKELDSIHQRLYGEFKQESAAIDALNQFVEDISPDESSRQVDTSSGESTQEPENQQSATTTSGEDSTSLSPLQNTLKSQLLSLSQLVDQLIEKPLPKKPTKKKKKSTKKKKKKDDEEEGEDKGEEEAPRPPTPPMWKQIESLGYNKRQVKEVLFYHLKQRIMNAERDALLEESDADASNSPSSDATTFIADQLRQREQYLSDLCSKHELSRLPFEKNTKKAEYLQNVIDSTIEEQLKAKQAQVDFLQHWVHANMNMKGNLLKEDEKLTVKNFMSLANTTHFPEVEGYSQEHHQMAVMIQKPMRSYLAKKRYEAQKKEKESNGEAAEPEAQKEKESKDEETSPNTTTTTTDGQSETEPEEQEQSNEATASEFISKGLEFYDSELQKVIDEVMEQVNSEWEQEQNKRKEAFEGLGMDHDIVDEPEGWNVTKTNISSEAQQFLDILRMEPDQISPSAELQCIKEQTEAYKKRVDTTLLEFLEKFATEQRRMEYEFHVKELERGL